MDSQAAVVARKWSRFEPDLTKSFFGFPPLRYYQIETAFGCELAQEYRHSRFWAEDILVDQYLREREICSVLSLCCGFGHVERRVVARLPGVGRCLGVDLAEGAVQEAKQRAVDAGLHQISYRVEDLNRFPWEGGEYDLVIANGALHHLHNLEGVLAGIKTALRAGGILYANEHVGASYQDYPLRQLELINAAAYLVPPELRGRQGKVCSNINRFFKLINQFYDVPDPGQFPHWSFSKRLLARLLRKLFAVRPEFFHFGVVHESRKERLLKTDPSEGVRSEEIIPLVQEFFGEVEVHPYGGGLLAYALDARFYASFDEDRAAHAKTLDMLCAFERHCMGIGEIGPEHAILVAEK